MASGIMRKAMVFLGLDDEEMDDYDTYDEGPVAPQSPRRYPSDPDEPVAGDRPLTGIRPMPRETPRDQSGSVRLAPAPVAAPAPAPMPVRPITPVTNIRVHVVVPARFADAQEIGEHCKNHTPVIVNLKAADGPLARRMIDFCSGVTYALSGRMEKVADQVFLLTPENTEVPAEERERLLEKGFYES
jgi:cell division inhibitor SepF